MINKYFYALLPLIFLGEAVSKDFKSLNQAELKKKLTPQQYQCTQENGTEPPFKNKYWDHKEDGIYVDIVSREPLFSSLHKYDSGSGWPSFTQPIEGVSLKEKKDFLIGYQRIEVRSSQADSHLGHVFDDGPGPKGLRYCINSASLDFIPLAQLSANNLGRYLFDFKDKKGWEIATLAGGCFWGMEDLIRKIPGVIETEVGYSGGQLINAKYEQVKLGTTGHAESVNILFDPSKTSFEKILIEFFKMHDPTTLNQQGNDKGTQYRSAIFYHTPNQKITAEAVIKKVNMTGAWKKPIVTEIKGFEQFWSAEDYHQDYLKKNPGGYTCHYMRKFDF